MRMINRTACVALGLALATGGATAASRAERRAEALASAVPAGKPESCISLSQIRDTRVRSDNVIDFYMSGTKVYRNTLPNSCPSLGFEEAFSYATSQSQLCSTDIITVLHQGGGMHGASCGLGAFQPVTGVKR